MGVRKERRRRSTSPFGHHSNCRRKKLNLDLDPPPFSPLKKKLKVLVGLGAVVAAALAGESNSSPASSSSSSSSATAPAPPPPRRDAVAVFGASGKVGRQIVKSLLSSSSRRTVVAAVRSAERARQVLSELGIDVDAAVQSGSLSIVGGVDVTNPATLSPNRELWEGVSQAAVSLGPVFARLPEGGMGYLDGMTSEAVDVSQKVFCFVLFERNERTTKREREREGEREREKERERERGRERERERERGREQEEGGECFSSSSFLAQALAFLFLLFTLHSSLFFKKKKNRLAASPRSSRQ